MSLAPAPGQGSPAHSATVQPRASFTWLLLACVFGAKHVAARGAFDHGVDVPPADTVRIAGYLGIVNGMMMVAVSGTAIKRG